MASFPKELLDGYKQFRAGVYLDRKQAYLELAEKGQKPKTLIIACCDSRSTPEAIFNCGPGELFIVRNVANLVPPYQPDTSLHSTSAAIEFAVQALKVEQIVVMGHGRCGGIQASLSDDFQPLSEGDFISHWIAQLKPVADALKAEDFSDPAERQMAAEFLSVKRSIENLRSFPFIFEAEKAGNISLHGAWFDISLGELKVLDPEKGEFT